jgi:glycosyltransferase involved in cell wall biosynthesis
MSESYNLCIIKPNKSAFSETFIQDHINRLAGNKKVLYGGAFPVYDDKDKFLIKSKFGILSYLVQKRIFKLKNIEVRNRALQNYLINNKIDIVFAEYGMVGALVTDACKAAGVPLIIHFHGADAYQKNNISEYAELYKKAFTYASAIISVSADMVERLKELDAPANKIFNASCGIDIYAFPHLDISKSGKNFLSVGRFVEKKSPILLVKAFKIVADKYPEAKLWMVGTGPLFDQTKALIKELRLENNIILTGVLKSEEIRRLMKRMRAFVQHSVTALNGDSEGTPVTILEASSSGLPVVSTRHGGIKEAVIDGVTGFLVDEYDIKGMAEKMIALAESTQLAVQLGKAARQHMIGHYQLNDRIKLLDHIIKSNVKPATTN